MPKKYTNYKLMTITCINKKTNSTKICCFIAFKYQDVESYIRIFEYLKNNFNFSPKIVHIDYEHSLRLSLLNQFQKENKPLILFCFFHFIKSIKERLKKIHFFKSKMNKESLEILKNIEIICFLNKDRVKDYQSYLINRLKSFENI